MQVAGCRNAAAGCRGRAARAGHQRRRRIPQGEPPLVDNASARDPFPAFRPSHASLLAAGRSLPQRPRLLDLKVASINHRMVKRWLTRRSAGGAR
jgi:hypothetical protein